MFRRWLCKWFDLYDPRLPAPSAELRELAALTPIERAELVTAACEHLGTRYLIDARHNRLVAYEREQRAICQNIPASMSADALVRRLCYLDGAISEVRWADRQLENAAEQAAQKVSETQVSG